MKKIIFTLIVCISVTKTTLTDDVSPVSQIIAQVDATVQTSADAVQAFQNSNVLFEQFLSTIGTVSSDRANMITSLVAQFAQLKTDFYTLRDQLLLETQVNQQINDNITQLHTVITNLEADKNNLSAQVTQLETNYNGLVNQNAADAALLLAKISQLHAASNQLATQRDQFMTDIQSILTTLQTHTTAELVDNASLLQFVQNIEGDLTIIESLLPQ